MVLPVSEQLVGHAPADVEQRQIHVRARERVGGTVGPDLRVGRPARLPRRPMRRALLHHEDRRRPLLPDHFGLPEVVGVNGIEPAHEAASRIPSCGSWFNTITTLPATFTPAKSSYWYSGAEIPYPANTSGASTETRRFPGAPS